MRLRWGSDLSSSLFGGGRRGFSSAWNHDYPRAEQNLSRIIDEVTGVHIRMDGSLILTLDDPELFNYPIAFMWEPGFWNLTDREAASFRAYLLKGGFAVFEDFDGRQQWDIFETQMRRVLPDARFVKLDKTHRIFDSFFQVKDIDAIVHPMSGIRPSYYGIFEDNDPSKRLMVVANYDNDVPEYLGVVRAGPVSVRRLERGVQAWGQLRHLWADALTRGSRVPEVPGVLRGSKVLRVLAGSGKRGSGKPGSRKLEAGS